MTFQSSNLSSGEAASLAALQRGIESAKAQGNEVLAWRYSVQACQIVNNATLSKLETGTHGSHKDEELFYTQVPSEYPGEANRGKGIYLSLFLIAGSPLTEKVIQLLKEDANDNL
jgi:hypothetical protein